jgi:RHS repeat-associated protein
MSCSRRPVTDGKATYSNNYLYRGEQYDSDLGLYYLRARYYGPFEDRFLSRDFSKGVVYTPQTLHKYTYASNDPNDAKDPRGQDAVLEYALVSAIVIQQAQPELLAVARLTCMLLTGTERVLTVHDLYKAVKDGPTETGDGDLSYFFSLAEKACQSLPE